MNSITENKARRVKTTIGRSTNSSVVKKTAGQRGSTFNYNR